MSQYVLSPAAQANLGEIWDYTCERWGDSQAEIYVRDIQRAIDRVAHNPLLGRLAMRCARGIDGMRSDRTHCITGLRNSS